MAVKYHCPKCNRKFVDWGAEKLGFKCPDCADEELVPVGHGASGSAAERPSLKRRRVKVRAEPVAPPPSFADEEEEAVEEEIDLVEEEPPVVVVEEAETVATEVELDTDVDVDAEDIEVVDVDDEALPAEVEDEDL